MDIPKIQVNSAQINSANVRTIGTNTVYIPNVPEWLTGNPVHSIPAAPPATVIIGAPVIDMPGCVEAHEQSDKSNKIIEDDEDNILVFCDAGVPSYDAMDYKPDELLMEIEAPPPPVVNPPESPDIDPPEVPPIDPPETECPAPNQPRVGDLTQNGEERVIGHELQGTTCVVLYEDTTVVEKFLPTANQVSTTASIAVVATAAAAATPLLLKVIKPIIKKLTTAIKKKLGKKLDKPTRSEIIANEYRAKKGLPPYKTRDYR